jgi:hypothetical protein
MTCQFDPAAIVELARGGESDSRVEAHVRGCPGCAQRLAQERALTAGLRGVAGSTREARPSPAIEGALLAAFAQRRDVAAAPAAPLRRWLAAAAAVLFLAGTAFYARHDFERARTRDAVSASAAAGNAFVPWPGSEVLPAFESGQLLRVELPASVLPLLGLVHAGAVNNKTVTADVLVGQDGLARAVRLAP